MHFSGTEEIAAPRQKVWDFLMNPDAVGSCGPGVQSIEVVDADHFNARAKVGVGFINATFNVHMTFVERVPLERAKIEARGQAPGSAVDAVGEMTLSDGLNDGTKMEWSANVNIFSACVRLIFRPAPCEHEQNASRLPLPRTMKDLAPMLPGMMPSTPE